MTSTEAIQKPARNQLTPLYTHSATTLPHRVNTESTNSNTMSYTFDRAILESYQADVKQMYLMQVVQCTDQNTKHRRVVVVTAVVRVVVAARVVAQGVVVRGGRGWRDARKAARGRSWCPLPRRSRRGAGRAVGCAGRGLHALHKPLDSGLQIVQHLLLLLDDLLLGGRIARGARRDIVVVVVIAAAARAVNGRGVLVGEALLMICLFADELLGRDERLALLVEPGAPSSAEFCSRSRRVASSPVRGALLLIGRAVGAARAASRRCSRRAIRGRALGGMRTGMC